MKTIGWLSLVIGLFIVSGCSSPPQPENQINTSNKNENIAINTIAPAQSDSEKADANATPVVKQQDTELTFFNFSPSDFLKKFNDILVSDYKLGELQLASQKSIDSENVENTVHVFTDNMSERNGIDLVLGYKKDNDLVYKVRLLFKGNSFDKNKVRIAETTIIKILNPKLSDDDIIKLINGHLKSLDLSNSFTVENVNYIVTGYSSPMILDIVPASSKLSAITDVNNNDLSSSPKETPLSDNNTLALGQMAESDAKKFTDDIQDVKDIAEFGRNIYRSFGFRIDKLNGKWHSLESANKFIILNLTNENSGVIAEYDGDKLLQENKVSKISFSVGGINGLFDDNGEFVVDNFGMLSHQKIQTTLTIKINSGKAEKYQKVE